MDVTVERRTSEEATLENAEPCRSDNNDVNNIQAFQSSSENANFATSRNSNPGEELIDKTGDDQGFVKPSEDFICAGTHPSRMPFVPDINSVLSQVPSSDEHLQRSLALEDGEEPRNEFSKICDHPAVAAPKSFDDVEDTTDGNVCARTSLIYDHSKRQCLESKSFLACHKNNENQTVNKRKKNIPQKATYHLQSLPSDLKQESCCFEDKNLSRSQTPIVTCSRKTNGTSMETKSNGHAHKASKRCAETYLSSAHLWPSSQGSARKAETGALESSWLSAYYANLFFSSFPLMFQNHSSMFSYPFLPSFNNPLNFVQQTSGSSSVSSRKVSLGMRNESAVTRASEKNLTCDPLKTSKINCAEFTPLRKFPGEAAPSFWSQVSLEDAAQELKRKYQNSQAVNDLKALDLSKSSCNRKMRRTLNPRSSFETVENNNNSSSVLSTLQHSVFSEFMKSSIVPRLSNSSDGESKESSRDYCKNYNGREPVKKSPYDTLTSQKSLPTSIIGNLGWMTNDLLLQPPIMPALSFLKWSPDELSDYVEKIDGCVETAKALRLHGISGSQLPMLTLDIMTRELGLGMTSAQNLMNIVRNLLSTTIPGDAL